LLAYAAILDDSVGWHCTVEVLGSPVSGGRTNMVPMWPFFEEECLARMETHTNRFSSSLSRESVVYGGRGRGAVSVLIGSSSGSDIATERAMETSGLLELRRG
jgi:hypothetical protein